MSGSVGVFSSESGAEGVDVTESASVGLNRKLTRNSQISGFLEEILIVIDRSALGFFVSD